MAESLMIKGLSKSFGRRSEKKLALNQVEVTFPQGAICGLLGNNGAGKTTLIKCISGLLLPDEGCVMFGGVDLLKHAKARRKSISVVLDGGRNLFWYMTVRENLRYFLMLKNQPFQDDLVKQILEQLGLTELENKQLQQLSFGMRQRVSIAVALASRSDIIFMDEPTNGLDIQYKEELIQLVKMIRERYQCTFIISSHDMSFVEKLCEYCALIDEGRIIHAGSLESFIHAFNSSEYIVRYKVTDENASIEKLSLKIVQHEEEKQQLRIAWPMEHPVSELIHELENRSLCVVEIDHVVGLDAAISMMTQQSKN